MRQLKVITGLPEKYRLVFVLREIEAMSIREISDLINIKETNIKIRLNRAKTMLRAKLDAYIKGNVYHYHLSRCNNMVNRLMNSGKPLDPFRIPGMIQLTQGHEKK